MQEAGAHSIIGFSSQLHLCFLPFVIKEKLTPLHGVAIQLWWVKGRHGLYSKFDNSVLIARRTFCLSHLF